MRERAVGEGRRRRAARARRRVRGCGSCRPAPFFSREGDDDLAPRQVIAEDDGGDRIGDALLGARDHVGREVLVAQDTAYSATWVVSFAICRTCVGVQREWIAAASEVG